MLLYALPQLMAELIKDLPSAESRALTCRLSLEKRVWPTTDECLLYGFSTLKEFKRAFRSAKLMVKQWLSRRGINGVRDLPLPTVNRSSAIAFMVTKATKATKATRQKLARSKAKSWKVTFPDGHTENITNLAAFCQRPQSRPEQSHTQRHQRLQSAKDKSG